MPGLVGCFWWTCTGGSIRDPHQPARTRKKSASRVVSSSSCSLPAALGGLLVWFIGTPSSLAMSMAERTEERPAHNRRSPFTTKGDRRNPRSCEQARYCCRAKQVIESLQTNHRLSPFLSSTSWRARSPRALLQKSLTSNGQQASITGCSSRNARVSNLMPQSPTPRPSSRTPAGVRVEGPPMLNTRRVSEFNLNVNLERQPV